MSPISKHLIKEVECSFDPDVHKWFYHLNCSGNSLNSLAALEIFYFKKLVY